tara:strand:+ start:12524 stop:13300 length:777 start_codon:yes stop_codon:yes gene_type:complete
MSEQELLVNKDNPAIWILTLNRPEARNALRTSLLKAIADTLIDADKDPELRCVIVTGGKEIFAAGADLNEMKDATAVDATYDPRVDYWEMIRSFRKPLIAAVNGFCLGAGNELAMRADIIIAGEDAQFGQPEINVGIMPGAGGTQMLTRMAGKAVAMKIAMTGEFIDAQTAFACGLVSEVVPSDEVMSRAEKLATKISRKSPLALRYIKESVLAAEDMPLKDALAFERRAFCVLFSSEDKKEGVSAFLEKRRPEFTGR